MESNTRPRARSTRKLLVPLPVTLIAALAACAGAGAPVAPTSPSSTQVDAVEPLTPEIRTDGITLIESRPLPGTDLVVSRYENSAYACGRAGMYPFAVIERPSWSDTPAPLWVMLHGGGIGWYDEAGAYVGDERFNDAETTEQLLLMAGGYLGADGGRDTFLAERVAAGDRLVLGSLCDHDLMMGIGQPYPDNPRGGTVDGLLANLAMLEAVRAGTQHVEARPTSTTWLLGQSAGSYGAWALAHNLSIRGEGLDGAVLDSGLLGTRSLPLHEAGVGADATVDRAAVQEKLGPYFSENSLLLERSVEEGFDVPLFIATYDGDPWCAGSEEPIGAAAVAGFDSNCAWLYEGVQAAITLGGNPRSQVVRVFEGAGHVVTATPGHPVQDELRAWFAAVNS